MIGRRGERVSGISVLAARHDDDDDDTQLNLKTLLFRTIQFRQSTVLPLRARVDLGAMAMKAYSAFPKALALLEPHHQII